MVSALPGFSAVTRQWFSESFEAATLAQEQAWAAIAAGDHTLVVAPTGSGKTLAAFLWAIDQTWQQPRHQQTSVLYVSPLKALAVDVERNLRAPLAGIARLSGQDTGITAAVRTGDTTAAQRRRLLSAPPEILITTPESLYLMLTSAARDTLRGVHTVIIDEVHAVAGSKRGSHLALSLERLAEITETEPQRIGLSATVRPPDTVAHFLAGPRPVTVVNPASEKIIEVTTVVPVPDLANPPAVTDDEDRSSGPSIWPHVNEAVAARILEQTSTLVFVNSRRLAERVTTQLNELHQEQTGTDEVIAAAHHGSVSKERRAAIEDSLKAGRLKAVVATSSLELGIDMGAVDLVIQIQGPPSVSSGLQRVGRAGHQVGVKSSALLFPTHRGDLLSSTMTIDAMLNREIEPIRPPRHPLDVLAQHIVAMTAMDDWDVDELYSLVRRAGPYESLPRSLFDAVLDMLTGKYPSEDFATLRPRVIWDRSLNRLSARPGSQRLAVTAGGTIPDRGLFGVFLVGDDESRRVGELDEEMVYESRVGEVFALGASTWRIEEITHDRVLVSPAPGQPPRLPFWHGDALGRPVELGYTMAQRLDELNDDPERFFPQLSSTAAANLTEYVNEQLAATEVLPGRHRIVVEQFRDEIGDRRVVIHTPLGARVHAPWALLLGEAAQERYGLDAHVMAADDGIVMRLPEAGADSGSLLDLVTFDPETISSRVQQLVGGSALFASRFRECASRALLFGQQQPGKRLPLWQQRQRSAQLLGAAARFDSFPIVLETIREVLQDVYDVAALTDLMREVSEGTTGLIEVRTSSPSPFARSLLFGYVAEFLYEGDSPLAERKSAALSLDGELLAELLGSADLRELLDPGAIEEVEQRLQHTGEYRARTTEQSFDVIADIGPVPASAAENHGIGSAAVAELLKARRILTFRHANAEWYAVLEDAARVRDGLGVSLPIGLPESLLAEQPEAFADLIARYARTHTIFTTAEVAEHFSLPRSRVNAQLEAMQRSGKLARGSFRPEGRGEEWSHPDSMRRLRRLSAARYRNEAEPLDVGQYATFPAVWQRVTASGRSGGERGAAGLLNVIEQLAGAPLPASQLDRLILPSRVRDYHPGMLDELTSSGAVTWWGIDRLPKDGWISLAPTALAPAYLTTEVEVEPEDEELFSVLASGGGWFAHQLVARLGEQSDVPKGLDRLLWSGLITNDTLAPVRETTSARRTRTSSRRRIGIARLAQLPSGRWSVLPRSEIGDSEAALIRAESLLIRHGIVSRGTSERLRFGDVYRSLSAMEERGICRRGYFVAGLGGAQFASSAAIDSARAQGTQPSSDKQEPVFVLAASDPANPYGAALDWPDAPTGSPNRRAGAFVVLCGGIPVVHGHGTALTVWEEERSWVAAAGALIDAVASGRVRPLTIKQINTEPAHQHPFSEVLSDQGGHETPAGVKLRRS